MSILSENPINEVRFGDVFGFSIKHARFSTRHEIHRAINERVNCAMIPGFATTGDAAELIYGVINELYSDYWHKFLNVKPKDVTTTLTGPWGKYTYQFQIEGPGDLDISIPISFNIWDKP